MDTHSEMIERIETILDQARPYLALDKGGVEFVSFDPIIGILELRFTGACAACPLQMMTLRAGIEKLLQNSLTEIKRVEKVI